ncbi:MAG: hypothetical protein ACRECW_06515 [Phyllobacterium sp.]
MKRIHLLRIMQCLVAVIGIVASAEASAQVVICGNRSAIVQQLETNYQEKQTAYGVIADEALMEIYVSRKGTWTIVITERNGRSCIVAAGHGWEQVPVSPGMEIRTNAKGS